MALQAQAKVPSPPDLGHPGRTLEEVFFCLSHYINNEFSQEFLGSQSTRALEIIPMAS